MSTNEVSYVKTEMYASIKRSRSCQEKKLLRIYPGGGDIYGYIDKRPQVFNQAYISAKSEQ